MKYILSPFLLAPLPAYAEVSDKMASIPQLWLQGIIGALILFILVRRSAWFSVAAVLVIAFFAAASYSTFTDPHIGPAIIEEQGTPYILSSYGSVVLMSVGFFGGLLSNRRSKKNAT